MDKRLILNEIQEALGFNVDAEFARYLEITPQRLAGWKSRGTFNTQILYTKCEPINPNYILRGEPPILSEDMYLYVDGYRELTEEENKMFLEKQEQWSEFIDDCFARKMRGEPFPYKDGVPSTEDIKVIEAKDKLIASQEERIKELKEYIELLKEKVKK